MSILNFGKESARALDDRITTIVQNQYEGSVVVPGFRGSRRGWFIFSGEDNRFCNPTGFIYRDTYDLRGISGSAHPVITSLGSLMGLLRDDGMTFNIDRTCTGYNALEDVDYSIKR